MANPNIRSINLLKVYQDGSTLSAEDQLAIEEPLEIQLVYGPSGNRQLKSISVTMRTPGNDYELATGFLFTEGILKSADDLLHAAASYRPGLQENLCVVELHEHVMPDISKLERHFYTSSSCGVCGKASIDAVYTAGAISTGNQPDTIRIRGSVLFGLQDILRNHQNVFNRTGGLHASALFGPEGAWIQSREDVGRHNALDKLIGYSLLNHQVPLHNHILLLSGRASFELVQKAAMAGIQIIAAVGAPSSLAVQTAEEFGITLIGFLKGDRYNVYTGAHRIQQAEVLNP